MEFVEFIFDRGDTRRGHHGRPARRWRDGDHGESRRGRNGTFDRLDIDDQQLLHAMSGASDHYSRCIEHEGGSIEDELVLAAHLVAVHEGHSTSLLDASAHLDFAYLSLAPVVGRGIHVDDDLSTTGCELRDGPAGDPPVLTDRHAHADPCDLVQTHGLGSGEKDTFLIEHRNVRKRSLVVGGLHFTIGNHSQCVVRLTVPLSVGEADRSRTPAPDRGRNVVKYLNVLGDEARLE
jgi:hypothetical protein